MKKVIMGKNSEIEMCLNYVAQKEKFESYEYEIKGGTSKSDGYLGDNSIVDLYGKDKTGKETLLYLFIKSSVDNSLFRKITPLQEVFEREIFIYNRVFRAFDDLQNEHNIQDKFPCYPRFYGYLIENGREHVILENIRPLGYNLHDRKEPMDMEHVKLIFKNYAKLHALSFALKNQKPTLFRELSENYSDPMAKFILQTNMLSSFTTMLQKFKKVLEENGDSQALSKLEHFNKDIPYIISTLCQEEKHDFVFLHGDGWNNNFMFKYQDEDDCKPTDVCVIDWQLSKLGSPVIDLTHHLYSCASKEELQHLEELLDFYYESFAEFLEKLGNDPKKLFPKHRLMRHYKKYAKYGVAFMMVLVRLNLVDEDESPDLLSAAEKGSFADAYTTDIRNQDMFDMRARNVLLHAAEKDLL